MSTEIERKFLVNSEAWKKVAKDNGTHYRQGYLSTDKAATVRVRLADAKAWITIKGPTTGASRAEYEYEIPVADARAMLDDLCTASLSKLRYRITYKGKLWEVDSFLEANQGLLLAEIELGSEDELFEIPDWIREEVTSDARYYNSYLSQHPFTSWEEG